MPSLALKMLLIMPEGVTPPIVISVPPSIQAGRRLPKQFEPTLEETGTIIMVIARRRRHARNN